MDDPQVPDLNALLGQAMEMQQQLMAAQAEAADEVVEGKAGGGAVVISVTGDMEFRSVTIRSDAVDPEDTSLLADMVLAALNDAMAAVQALQARSMGALGTMFGSDGVPDLSGLMPPEGIDADDDRGDGGL